MQGPKVLNSSAAAGAVSPRRSSSTTPKPNDISLPVDLRFGIAMMRVPMTRRAETDSVVRAVEHPSLPGCAVVSRHPYAHDATVTMAPDADERAPGGAITVALCGSWDHEPPCPLAPHHTRAERRGDQLVLRVLFAAEPHDEPRVRTAIHDALAHGSGSTPERGTVTWHLDDAGPSDIRDDEREHAARLGRS